MAALNTSIIRSALAAMGAELRAEGEVELLVIGGAAGLLTEEFPDGWTTSDVDTVEFHPPTEVEEVLRAAAEVGVRLGLAANWMNIEAGLFAHDLPEGWEKRRRRVGVYGKLHVWALGRLDLIAMKFFAHRPVDRMHLSVMRVTAAELRFVRKYLKIQRAKDARRAEMALAYVDAWGVA